MTVAQAAASKEAPQLPPPSPVIEEGRALGILLVLMAGVFWSTSGLFVRAMEVADAWQLLFYRSLSVVICAFAFMVWRRRGRVLADLRDGLGSAMLGGFFLMIASTGFVFALFYTSVANAVFMLATGPFMTAILARIVLKEAIRPATWVTMVIAGGGVAYMVGGAMDEGRWLGNLMAFLSIVGFACYAVLLRAVATRHRHRETMPIVVFGGLWTALIAALLVDDFQLPLRDLTLCLAMGAVQIVLGMILFLKGASRVTAAELALLSMTEVVLSPLWVWMVFSEVPAQATMIGGAIVMLAVGLRALSGLRRRPTTLKPV